MEWVANLLSKEQESVDKFELVRPEESRIVKNQFFIFWAEWRRCHPITDLGDLRVGFGGRVWGWLYWSYGRIYSSSHSRATPSQTTGHHTILLILR